MSADRAIDRLVIGWTRDNPLSVLSSYASDDDDLSVGDETKPSLDPAQTQGIALGTARTFY